MEENTQKVESYDRIQSQYQREIMELLKTDPRLQATEEGMVRAVDIIGKGYYNAAHGLAQSLTMDAARIYQEKRARDGLEPAQLGSTTLRRVEARAQRILDTTIDQLRDARSNSLELGAKLAEVAGPEIDSQLQSIAMDELVATDERPSDNLAATIAMEDTLTRMNENSGLHELANDIIRGGRPATTMEIREAATRIVADSRGKIDRMKTDLSLDLSQGPRPRKLAEWAMNNERVKRAIHNGICDAIKMNDLSSEPAPDQDMLIREQVSDSLQSVVDSGYYEGAPEAGTHPFTTPEYEGAAWMVVDFNPEMVERAVEEGRAEAAEERNDWWHTSLEYSEEIEGLPLGWRRIEEPYTSMEERGYTIVDPEGRAAYEYRASDGYSRWDGDEWSPAAKGEDPVQQIKDMLEQAEQGKVNALVQATHAPEAAATDLQAGAMTQEALAGHLRKRETKEAIQL